jgi:uncharacterized radical SAM superfamily protein
MNSIARAFRRSEFEDPASPWLELFIGVVIVLCAIAIGAVFGFEHRDRLQRVIDAQPKARPVVQNPPPFLIGCDRPAVEEVARTCKARLRAGKVGAL